MATRIYNLGWVAVQGVPENQASVLVINGVVQADQPDLECESIDAQGGWLVPGLVDLSARLREPGFEYKATLESEMAAALAGGVTSLSCPPDTEPVLDEPGLVEMLKHRATNLKAARLYPLGALTVGLKGEAITEMAELAEAGCIGFSHAGAPLTDTQTLMRAMQYASTFGFTVWLSPQDAFLARGGVAASGAVATRLGLPSIPVAAETVALHTIFELVRATGCKVHLCRLSSAQGVELLRQAKREGLPVTADVAVHHLHLTDLDIGFFDSHYRVDPPFRGQRDRDALRMGLADGTIDAVCSDHTPVDDDSKLLPFSEAEAGTSALELLLPLSLQWANDLGIDHQTWLERVVFSPMKILGVQASPKDMIVVAPKAEWLVSRFALRSQGQHTPYLNRPVIGRVVATLVDGQVVSRLPAA
jgi:dihydroorotase